MKQKKYKKKTKLEKVKVVGKSPTDGKLVVKGIFKLFDTTGLPLFIIFDTCEQNNWLPSWIDFYKEAIKGGWSHKTIVNRLSEALSDTYGTDFKDVVIDRLNKIFMPT